MKRTQMIKGYLLVITSAVIFGCLPLLVKGIYADGVNSLSTVFLRNALSAPMVGLLALCQHKTLKIPVKTLPSVAAIGLMGCFMAPLMLFSSYSFIASGIATVFHFVYPAVVVVGGILFCRERMTKGNLISVLLCVVGICLFYTPGQPLDWRGTALALLSGVAYAAYILLLAHFRHRDTVAGFLLNFYTFSINALMLLVICLLGNQLTLPVSLRGWLLCLLLALVVNVGAVAMFQQGTFLIGGPQASVLSTLEPITGVFMGAVVFQEVVTVQTALGSALVILAGVLIVVFALREEKGNTTP